MANIAQFLTEHMDIWTAAETEKKSGRGRASGNTGNVYGVKKLRELILELAVRGKLVPPDTNDEPAYELLKRIQVEKAKLIAKGKLKKEKPLAPIDEDEKPFELPKGWEWTSLLNVAVINPRNIAPDDTQTSFVPMTLIGTAFGDIHQDEKRLWKEIKQGFTHFAEGDIGLAKITPCFENSKACVFENLENGLGAGTTELHIVRPIIDTLNPRYVLAYLKSPRFLELGESKMTGTAGQKRLPKDFVESNPFPLPPLAEQHRIVAKVDELMALCDQLERQHSNAQEAHKALVSQLLATLTQSQSAAEFNANWQRIYAHFDVLFTTEASIDILKQTLLQLAVMGKLVPQDANDEPASKLFKRIQAEKAKLIAIGKLKKEKPLASVSEDEIAFELPKGWELTKLTEIIKGMDSGWSPACYENPSPSEDVWGVLKTTSVQVMKYLELENKELPENLHPRPEAEVKAGDILFTRAGPKNRVGISCYIESTRLKLMISDKIIRFHPVLCDGRFVTLSLSAGIATDHIEKSKSGMAESQVNVSQEKLKATPILLPPLAEQHRIVAKLDKLLALCDQLKVRIQQVNQQQQTIADVLVAQAVA